MSRKSLCFNYNEKIEVHPCKPYFSLYKVGFIGVLFTCYRNELLQMLELQSIESILHVYYYNNAKFADVIE